MNMKQAKLSDEQVQEILLRLQNQESVVSVAAAYGVSRQAIYNLLAQQSRGRAERSGIRKRSRIMRKTVGLRGGGSLTVVFSGDFFALTAPDVDLIQSINEIMDYYASAQG